MTSIYLGNLSWDLDEDALYDAIAQTAEPTTVEIMKNKSGRSLGYAIAKFEVEEDATAVIAALNGQNLEGREVNAREDRGASPPKERKPRAPRAPRAPRSGGSGGGDGGGGGEEAPTNRVYIGNLSWDTDSDGLLDYFQDFNIVSAVVQLQSSGASKGWALAEFGSPADAEAAINDLNNTELDGRVIVVRPDRPPQRSPREPRAAKPRARRERRVMEEGAPSQWVFIGNLSWDMEQGALGELLNGYGVEEASVQLRPDGKSRGFALARFESVEEASRAIDELNGEEVMGRNILLKFDAVVS